MREMRIQTVLIGRPATVPTETIVSLDHKVTPEGDAAIFSVELDTGQPLNVKVPFQQIGDVGNIIRKASATMNARLRQRPRMAASEIYGLVEAAQKPERFELFVDPATGEWIFLYHFLHGAPMSLRVDPAQCLENMQIAMKLMRTAMN